MDGPDSSSGDGTISEVHVKVDGRNLTGRIGPSGALPIRFRSQGVITPD
jgi:hypothetical protein